MSFRSTFVALVAVAGVACIAVPALTQDNPSTAGATAGGDAQRGRKLSYTCYGCHGVDTYKNVYPTYSVPKLQGQHPEYLAAALLAYKNGERSHMTMHAQAASMNEQDMQDIAAFLAGKPIAASAAATSAPANMPKKVTEICAACHGTNGVGTTPLYPTISGQHADYIARALHDYKSGARKNAIMAGFAAQLSDKDIAELSKYFSKQKPSLSTAEHAIWFTGEKKHAAGK